MNFLTTEEWQYVLNVLGQCPHTDVAGIINKIAREANKKKPNSKKNEGKDK